MTTRPCHLRRLTMTGGVLATLTIAPAALTPVATSSCPAALEISMPSDHPSSVPSDHPPMPPHASPTTSTPRRSPSALRPGPHLDYLATSASRRICTPLFQIPEQPPRGTSPPAFQRSVSDRAHLSQRVVPHKPDPSSPDPAHDRSNADPSELRRTPPKVRIKTAALTGHSTHLPKSGAVRSASQSDAGSSGRKSRVGSSNPKSDATPSGPESDATRSASKTGAEVSGHTVPAPRADAKQGRRLGAKRSDPKPRSETPASGEIAARAALRQLGIPFSWGGGSPTGPTRGVGRGARTTGFDCSGLTLHAWSQAGVKLSHHTGAQFRQGRRITLKNLRRGDLVFFGGGSGDPTHVGLYVGRGAMIHAPKTGDVVRKTSFLGSAYFRSIFRGAVRPS
jgi:cell wall-associated NlpC family hydrolase